MKFRKLGNTEITVSEIGFGCMSLGKNPPQESIALIHRAIDAGVNYFDTADIYDAGANEELVGKALAGHRKKVILATKTGNVIRPGGGKAFGWDPSKEHILRSVENSLKRLQTDYIDLYQLHGGTIDDPIDETIEAFEILKSQGKILRYGISSIRPNVIREYVKRSRIASVMLQYNLLDRRPEEEILTLLEQNGISVMARGALAQGLLADKPAKEYLAHSRDEVAKIRELLTKVSGSVQNNVPAAIGFVLQNPAVTSTVIGFRTEDQLAAALRSFSLSNDDLEILRAVAPASKYENHR